MFRWRSISAWAGSLLVAAPALAHHSPASYDMTQEVVIEGTVAELDWKNPHIYLTVETLSADSQPALQSFELASIASLQPYGLTRETLPVGLKVEVRAHPPRRPGGRMLALDLTTEEGALFRLHPRGRGVILAATAPAEGIAGQWLPPPASLLDFIDAVDTAALTERARTERGDAAALAASQASCAGYFPPPQLMIASYLHVIEVTDAAVVIRVDGVPGERVIHLDGRALEADADPASFGHSVGRWEGETLVIDSAGFTPNRQGVGRAVPSGPGKRMLERLTLSEDRRQLL
jgi:hypothetical protein